MYDKNIGRYALPGSQKSMSSDEFFDLICDSGVVSDTFGQREIGKEFNLAMQTCVDELTQQKHLSMVLIEFMEAISWVASKLSNIPTIYIDPDPSNKYAEVLYNEEDMNSFLGGWRLK